MQHACAGKRSDAKHSRHQAFSAGYRPWNKRSSKLLLNQKMEWFPQMTAKMWVTDWLCWRHLPIHHSEVLRNVLGTIWQVFLMLRAVLRSVQRGARSLWPWRKSTHVCYMSFVLFEERRLWTLEDVSRYKGRIKPKMHTFCYCKVCLGPITCKPTYAQTTTGRGKCDTHKREPLWDPRFCFKAEWAAGFLPKAWRNRNWKKQGDTQATKKDSTAANPGLHRRLQQLFAGVGWGQTAKASGRKSAVQGHV